MIVESEVKPPTGGMGGSIHDWERGTDPFHPNKFPDHIKDLLPECESVPCSGWFALDGCGNQIGFVKDGAEI